MQSRICSEFLLLSTFDSVRRRLLSTAHDNVILIIVYFIVVFIVVYRCPCFAGRYFLLILRPVGVWQITTTKIQKNLVVSKK